MPDQGRRVLLLGYPVRHSFSVAFQNAGFEAAGLPWRYEAVDLPAEQLHGFVEKMRGDNSVVGANVTIPHKETVMPLLDELDPGARGIGAVNTISSHGGKLKGWNTDLVGFNAALHELGFDPREKVALVVGAGGAARAVAAALAPIVDRLLVANRSLLRARELCRAIGVERCRAIAYTELDPAIQSASLVVNATPADLPEAISVSPPKLSFDLRSSKSHAGRLMLLHQGIASFEIWAGRPAPVDAMRAALIRAAEGVSA